MNGCGRCACVCDHPRASADTRQLVAFVCACALFFAWVGLTFHMPACKRTHKHAATGHKLWIAATAACHEVQRASCSPLVIFWLVSRASRCADYQWRRCGWSLSVCSGNARASSRSNARSFLRSCWSVRRRVLRNMAVSHNRCCRSVPFDARSFVSVGFTQHFVLSDGPVSMADVCTNGMWWWWLVLLLLVVAIRFGCGALFGMCASTMNARCSSVPTNFVRADGGS